MPPNNDHTPHAEVRAADQGETPRSGFRNMRALGLSALAVVLYILLLDAAVETFISGSPVRWWVAVIMVTYFAAIALLWGHGHPLWQRLGWKTRGITSLFVFLGLLTITVWLPGGLTDGVRMLGQSTSTLLVVVTVFAVAFSGIILTRPSYPHPAVKWAIRALAGYAVIAFLWAIHAVTSYPDLFRGESFWRWLPRWFQGSFIGAFVLVPAAVLYHIASSRLRTPGVGVHQRGLQTLALGMSVAMAIAGLKVPGGSAQTQVKISDRGPGMRRQSLDSLALPVPRTFDLTHVDPAYFAVALGNDPAKIFVFVRDQIAFEAYTGSLRGPRGTLMAMAGNSLDRAALLGALLDRAGHRVRYVRGRLPEPDARDLVMSMWTDQPRPSRDPSRNTLPATQPSKLMISAVRDYALIRNQLRKVKVAAQDSAPPMSALVEGARTHYWVQWAKNNTWIDLDPSFSDSSPGHAYARVEATFNTLPEDVFHRVSIRVRIEESTGDVPSTREILVYNGRASDLAGVDFVLNHQPENWRGPVASLSGALTAAIENTGRIKPVLIVGGQFVAGEVFRPKLETAGIGSLQTLLSGAGTRNSVPIAVSEWIEFDFVDPDGHKETVVREIFDAVGKTRRERNQFLSWDEIRSRTEAKDAFDVTKTTYGIFITTGRVEAAHLSRLDNRLPTGRDYVDVRAAMRRINIAFAVASDAILAQAGRPERSLIRFYPDSPRVQIVAFSARPGRWEVSLDLRRDRSRVVVLGSHPEDAVAARILRGVLNGALERLVMEYVTKASSAKVVWSQVVSTSLIFERGSVEGVSTVLLPAEVSLLGTGIPEDAFARLREDSLRGYLAIAPQRAIAVAGVSRFGWWRVDPRSGETIAMTDQGLHGGEYVELTRENVLGEVYYVGTSSEEGVVMWGPILDEKALDDLVWSLMRQGFTPVSNPSWLPLIWPIPG